MLRIETFTVTAFQQNCRLLWKDGTDRALVIDPGGEVERVLAALDKNKLTLEAILLTHSHIDHCGGVAELLAKTQQELPLYGHSAERAFRERLLEQAKALGLPGEQFKACPEPTHEMSDSQLLEFSCTTLRALFTPGHAPGHFSFFSEEKVQWMESGDVQQQETNVPFVIAGDALFNGSIGRTDLPLANHEQLLRSIREKLFRLPAETHVLPGHGPNTVIGWERTHNPFLLMG